MSTRVGFVALFSVAVLNGVVIVGYMFERRTRPASHPLPGSPATTQLA